MMWILGPQLIGTIMLLVGFIQSKFPPKRINALYGYRTTASMQNQETWDEANNYSLKLMLKCGAVAVVIGLVISLILSQLALSDDVRYPAGAVLIVLTAIVIPIILGIKTERHLKERFK